MGDAPILVSRVQAARPRDRWTLVYFLRAADGPIKIGVTDHLNKRLQILQCGHFQRLEYLMATEGTPGCEAKLHRKFKKFHIRGEWFEAAPELLKFIAALKKDRFGKNDNVRALQDALRRPKPTREPTNG